jgi:hypothetical protein
MVPDPREVAILQDVQQFCLEAGIDLGNFIEEQRAPLRQLHATWLRRVRAGERPFLKTEELAFNQGGWNRRTIHFDEGSLIPGGTLMDKTGQNFFPGAAFT